jgi:anion-transporting  ArsA/GET3 family ATPase
MLERRLIIVSGKGGVGKSAISVALALRAQRAGQRVLLSAMIDQVGAAIHLGADRLGYEPATFHGGIQAMAIDRAEALDEYLKMQLRIPAAAPTRALSRAMQVLADTAPGIREVITMGKPIFDVWQGHHDLVIVDAPPLGQLMSYLRAPAVVADLVPTGAVRDQARRMGAMLVDAEQAALVLITTPEELPALETREALAELESERLVHLGAVIANRVLPLLDVPPERLATLPNRPASEAAAHHVGLLDVQDAALTPLPIDIRLPYLFGVHTPTEVSARLADAWDNGL